MSRTILNRAPRVIPTKAAGKSLDQRLKNLNRYREQFNPLRGLTITKAVGYLEQYQRGEYADLMWVFYFIEQADPDLFALISRRTSAISELDWQIKVVETAQSDADKVLAEAQAAYLRAVYDGIQNLNQGIEALALATFRGFTVMQKQRVGDNGQRIPAQTGPNHLEVIDPWRILRDGMAGDFYFNPEGLPKTVTRLDAGYRIDPASDAVIIREVARPLIRIALLKFIRANLSEKDWDSFIEIYGIPSAIIIGPPDVPESKASEYRDAAEQAAEGGSGYLPNGSSVYFGKEAAGQTPFKARLDHLTEKLILAGTGGMLTMLTQSGSGTLAGGAHSDTFNTIARAEAREISALFQKYIDAAELEARFPGQPRLAYFEIAAKDKVDVSQVIQHAQGLAQAGIAVDLQQLGELTGYKLTARPAAAPTPAPSPFGLLNREGEILNAIDEENPRLEQSAFDRFDRRFAEDVRRDWPEIWQAGGNIRGNEAYEYWGKYLDGDRGEGTLSWVKEREAWAARHYNDGAQFKDAGVEPNLSNIAGVIAQVKWGVVGTLGLRGMKRVIFALKAKIREEARNAERAAEPNLFLRPLLQAAGKDLDPVKAKVRDLLKIKDDAAFVEALNSLRNELPQMVGDADNLAAALEQAMSAAFANGIEEGATR